MLLFWLTLPNQIKSTHSHIHTVRAAADQPKQIRFVIAGDPQPLRRHRVANNR